MSKGKRTGNGKGRGRKSKKWTTVGNLIKHRRKQKGWSQMKLAEEVDVHLNTVTLWESGKVRVGVDNVLKLVAVLGGKAEDYMQQ